MRIPTADNQVQLNALPTVRRERLVSTAGESLGQALGNVGNVVSQIQLEEKQKADSAAVFEADTATSAAGNNLLMQARQVKGKDAIGIADKMLPEYDKQVAELEKGIVSKRAKTVYQQQAAQRRLQLQSQLGTHEANERESYYDQTYQAAVKQSKTAAGLAAGNDKIVDSELANQEAIIRNRGKQMGQSQELVDLAVATARADTHQEVLDRLLSAETIVGTAKAQAYLEKVQDQLPSDTVKQYKNQLQDLTVKDASRTLSNDLLAKYGTNYKAALDQLRKDTKIPTDVADQAASRIKQEWALAKQAEAQDESDALEQATAFVNSGRSFNDMPASLKNRLKPSTYASLRSVTETPTRKQSDLTYMLNIDAMDPQDIGDLTQDQVAEWANHLTPADYEQRVARWAKIKNGTAEGKDAAFRSVAQMKAQRVQELFGSIKPGNEKANAKRNLFLNDFEARLKVFQEDKGKKATGKEAQQILDEMTVEVSLNGFFAGSKKAYELTDDDIGTDGNPRKPAVKVPKADRDIIIRSLLKVGAPVTEDSILEMYLSE